MLIFIPKWSLLFKGVMGSDYCPLYKREITCPPSVSWLFSMNSGRDSF